MSDHTVAQRVLVVDDEEVNRVVLDAYLAPLGYEIEAVANGQEALLAIDRNPPDISPGSPRCLTPSMRS